MGDAVAGGGGSLRGRSAAAAALSTVNNPIVLNMVMNPAVLSRAKNAVVTRIMIFITLIPLVCRGPRTIDGGTPYSPPAGRAIPPLHIFEPSQSTTSRATTFLMNG